MEFVILGCLLLVQVLKMEHKKVKAILEWSTLRSVTEVRHFHGLESFYRISLGVLVVFMDPWGNNEWG